MTLIVEDGTGVDGANTFVDDVNASAWFEENALENWEDIPNEADRNTALRLAFKAMSLFKWNGYESVEGQAWPRQHAFNRCEDYCDCPSYITGVPSEAISAQLLIAYGIGIGQIDPLDPIPRKHPRVTSFTHDGISANFFEPVRLDTLNGGCADKDYLELARRHINCFLEVAPTSFRCAVHEYSKGLRRRFSASCYVRCDIGFASCRQRSTRSTDRRASNARTYQDQSRYG